MNKKSESVHDIAEDDDLDLNDGRPISTPFDTSEYLDNAETRAAYLDEALKTGDAQFFAKCLGQVAKAIGMTELARRSGISRQTLYDALSGGAMPRLDTIFGVLHAMDVRLSAVAPPASDAQGEKTPTSGEPVDPPYAETAQSS